MIIQYSIQMPNMFVLVDLVTPSGEGWSQFGIAAQSQTILNYCKCEHFFFLDLDLNYFIFSFFFLVCQEFI